MHESGIAQRLLEAALAAAAEHGTPGRLAAVEIEAGPDAPMSDEALRFHWTELVVGTAAEGAVLRIVPVDDPEALRLVAIDVDGP